MAISPQRRCRDFAGYKVPAQLNTQIVPTIKARIWCAGITVYDHLGAVQFSVQREEAQELYQRGDYHATGTKRRIEALVHKGPPDGREISDQNAMRTRGSRKPVFREHLDSGQQCWKLKPQRTPWRGLHVIHRAIDRSQIGPLNDDTRGGDLDERRYRGQLEVAMATT